MLALIDGDTIAYRCAAATERKWYDVRGDTFKYKKEAVAYCTAHGISEEEITWEVVTEDIGNTLNTVKLMLNSVLEDTKADEHEIYLTGEDNYRYELATILPYKGTRTLPKPSNLKDVVSYLQSEWGAMAVEGVEADDILGCRQCECTKLDSASIICTTDKDLLMIPGWHYNIAKKTTQHVNEKQAAYHFYTQLLTGDRTDNIQGIVGVGEKTAEKILDGCEDEMSMYLAVFNKYKEVHGNRQAYPIMEENAHLLWIQRERGVLWTPPQISL